MTIVESRGDDLSVLGFPVIRLWLHKGQMLKSKKPLILPHVHMQALTTGIKQNLIRKPTLKSVPELPFSGESPGTPHKAMQRSENPHFSLTRIDL